jgi:hypothetical protein
MVTQNNDTEIILWNLKNYDEIHIERHEFGEQYIFKYTPKLTQ